MGVFIKIEVKDNNVEQALRVLKRKLQRDGFFKVIKLKNTYEKPSEKKKRILQENIKRVKKLNKLKNSDIEIESSNKKIKKYVPLSKRQDKPDSALWLIKEYSILKDSQIARLVGITKNTVTSIRNKSYWNYNNLNPNDPVALNLFSQKDLIEADEKAQRRIKREKKEKEKALKNQ